MDRWRCGSAAARESFGNVMLEIHLADAMTYALEAERAAA